MPFQHEAIIQGIKSMFFRGPRSFSARNEHLFQVSINNTRIRVLPPSMIAIVTTAVSFVFVVVPN